MSEHTLVRPLDRAEAFFWFLDCFSSMNFAVIAEGTGQLNADVVTQALAATQRRHPLLGVTIDADHQGRLHFAKKAGAIPLTRLDADDWRTALAERIVAPFVLGTAPLVRACQFALADGRWVFALIMHHAIGDARSAFSVLGEVLQRAAGEVLPDTPLSIQPALADLYPPAFSGDAGRQLAEQMKALRKAATERTGFPAPQAGHHYSDEQQPRIISLRFSATEAGALADRARAAQATVNGLIGAAQLIALREQFGDETEKVLGLTCAADLRPHLSVPVGTETPGFYVTLVTSIQRVGDAATLLPLAQRLTAAIRQQITAGAGHLFYDFMPPADQFPADANGIANFNALMARGVQTSLLSNVGRLPALPALNGLSVNARSFALCPTRTQPVFTAVTTDENGMVVNLNFNAAQLAPALATAVAQSMERQLREVARLA